MKTSRFNYAALLVLCATLAVCFLSGCTTTSYTDPSGAKFSRTSFLNTQAVSEVTYSDSTKKLELKGYTSEQTKIVEAAVTAAVKAAK